MATGSTLRDRQKSRVSEKKGTRRIEPVAGARGDTQPSSANPARVQAKMTLARVRHHRVNDAGPNSNTEFLQTWRIAE